MYLGLEVEILYESFACAHIAFIVNKSLLELVNAEPLGNIAFVVPRSEVRKGICENLFRICGVRHSGREPEARNALLLNMRSLSPIE